MNFTELAAAGVKINITSDDEFINYHFQWKTLHYKHKVPLVNFLKLTNLPLLEDELVKKVMYEFSVVARGE